MKRMNNVPVWLEARLRILITVRVDSAHLFGSYLYDRGRARDVDLAILARLKDGASYSEEYHALSGHFSENFGRQLHVSQFNQRERCDYDRFVRSLQYVRQLL